MSWRGVKNQSLKFDIEAWCEKMGIENYTINDEGEIDVDGHVNLSYQHFKELPYKFKTVKGFFSVFGCKNLTSLKNCPDIIGGSFSSEECPKINSLEGCPKKVGGSFLCRSCKRKITREEINSLCKVKESIYN